MLHTHDNDGTLFPSLVLIYYMLFLLPVYCLLMLKLIWLITLQVSLLTLNLFDIFNLSRFSVFCFKQLKWNDNPLITNGNAGNRNGMNGKSMVSTVPYWVCNHRRSMVYCIPKEEEWTEWYCRSFAFRFGPHGLVLDH
jgi:hypothetical protein